MRVILASLACATLVGAASAVPAKPVSTALPTQAALDSMSPAEFRAFLASPALNKQNVLRAYHQKVAAASGPSCPIVDNDGFNSDAATSTATLSPFAQLMLFLSNLFGLS